MIVPLLIFLSANWIYEKYISKHSDNITAPKIINTVDNIDISENLIENTPNIEIQTSSNEEENKIEQNKIVINEIELEIQNEYSEVIEDKTTVAIEKEKEANIQTIETNQSTPINLNKKFSARKVDWEKVNQLKSDIGKAGEEIAVQYFKTIYKEVKHSSTIWDGLGYDIELIDIDDIKFYTEIKTTTKEFGQNIFMSQNEVDFMNNNPDKFILCIVHDLNLDNKEAEIKIVSGKEEINNFFDFEAQSFSISFK